MNNKRNELKEDIRHLEDEANYLASQIFQKQTEIDHREAEINNLNWRRQSILQMLKEDRTSLDVLDDEQGGC